MIHFPLGDGQEFVVIEPGNIARLKAGRPLKVGGSLVAFTPDIQAFVKLLDMNEDWIPNSNGPEEFHEVKLTPEKIQEALTACQDLPEVLR